MDETQRKAALSDYKERKVEAGIYAIRCAPTGQCWIGRAPDLSTIRNRLWFQLRQGEHGRPTLQHAWREHGAEAFSFEVVEAIEEAPTPYLRDKALKARLDHWREALPAEAV